MHPHSTQSRNYTLTYSCTCVSTHFSTHIHPHSHMTTHSCTHVGFCTHSGANTYAQHSDTQEYAPADTHMLCAQAASHSLTQQATWRGASLPSFHPERKGHGIGSPDSRDATNQATWKGRHRPSLEAEPGIPLFFWLQQAPTECRRKLDNLTGSQHSTEHTNLAGGGSICDGDTEVKSQEQLITPGKVGAQAFQRALQTLFSSFLIYPPGSPHFSLCSLSCPSPRPWESPALSAVSCMLTYNPSDPGGDRYFPTPFSVLGTGALVRDLQRTHSSPVPFYR